MSKRVIPWFHYPHVLHPYREADEAREREHLKAKNGRKIIKTAREKKGKKGSGKKTLVYSEKSARQEHMHAEVAQSTPKLWKPSQEVPHPAEDLNVVGQRLERLREHRDKGADEACGGSVHKADEI